MNDVGKTYINVKCIILTILLIINICVGGFALYFENRLLDVDQYLAEFKVEALSSQQLTNSVYRELGYGGFIHAYKNYISQHDNVYKIEAIEQYYKLVDVLNQYENYDLSTQKKTAVSDIRTTIDLYFAKLDLVDQYIKDGFSSKKIESYVEIDDKKALSAISFLQDTDTVVFAESIETLSSKIWFDASAIYALNVSFLCSIIISIFLFWWSLKADLSWRRVTKRLHSSESRYKKIISNTADAIITIDSKGKIDSFNRAATSFFGYSEIDILGQNVSILIPEDEQSKHDLYLKNSEASQNKVINSVRGLTAVRKNSSTFPIELNISPFFVEGEKYFVGIIRDITEKKKTEKLLLENMDKAVSAHAAKNMFISSMNHELRTPLNAIIGFSDILKKELFGKLPSDRYRQYVNDINNAGQHLLLLITDLLDLDKIEEGKFELDKKSSSLRDLVAEVVKLINPLCEKDRINFNYDLENFDYCLSFDALRIKQVLLNILSNSVKFTKPGGKVTLSAKMGDNGVILTVHDTGIGISKDDLLVIFEPFSQGIGLNNTLKPGTGLGLTISKKFIELHDGSLQISSELGKGTVAEIFVPF